MRKHHHPGQNTLIGFIEDESKHASVVFHLAIKKQDGAFGLILRRCRDASFDRKMRQKRLDIGRAQITWMTLVKMNNEAFNPIVIGLLCANTVMLPANLVKKLD